MSIYGKTAAGFLIPLALTILGIHADVFNTDGSLMASVNVYMSLVALTLYVRAVFILVNHFNEVQSTLGSFKVSGWLRMFSSGHYIGGHHILRLAMISAALLAVLKIKLILTNRFYSVMGMDVMMWHVAHLSIAAMLVFIGNEYARMCDTGGETSGEM